MVVRWLIWKQPFMPFLTQPGPTFWKTANSLNRILVFNWWRNTSYIISFVTLRPTNLKWNSWRKWLVFLPFLMFEPDREKVWPWYPSNVAFLAIFAWNFHSGVCVTTTCCFKMHSFLVQNMKKNLGIDNITQFLSRGLGKGVLLVGPSLHKRDLHDPRPKENTFLCRNNKSWS